MKLKKYAVGSWCHLFGPGRSESRCRIVVDLETAMLVAAQVWTGLKYVEILGERLNDLSVSVIEVNQAHLHTDLWAPELELQDELPDWVDPMILRERSAPLQGLAATDDPRFWAQIEGLKQITAAINASEGLLR